MPLPLPVLRRTQASAAPRVGTLLPPRCFLSKIKAKLVPHQELQSTLAGGCFIHPFSPYINNGLISFPLGSAVCCLAGEGALELPSPHRLPCRRPCCPAGSHHWDPDKSDRSVLCLWPWVWVCFYRVYHHLAIPAPGIWKYYISEVTRDPQAHLSRPVLHSANECPLSMSEVIR